MYFLCCRTCSNEIAERAVFASLIPNKQIKLYSTSKIKKRNIFIFDRKDRSFLCHCVLKQIYCRKCVKCIGYCVIDICAGCKENNGHRYMFGLEEVFGTDYSINEELFIR